MTPSIKLDYTNFQSGKIVLDYQESAYMTIVSSDIAALEYLVDDIEVGPFPDDWRMIDSDSSLENEVYNGAFFITFGHNYTLYDDKGNTRLIFCKR